MTNLTEQQLQRVRNCKQFIQGKESIYSIYNRHRDLDFVITKDVWQEKCARVVSIKHVHWKGKTREVGEEIAVGERLKRRGFHWLHYEVEIQIFSKYSPEGQEPSVISSQHLNVWYDMTNVAESDYWDSEVNPISKYDVKDMMEDMMKDNRQAS
jgi:hypothetical protein